MSTFEDGRTSSATLSKVIRPSLESASSVAASARVACLHTSRIEKPCFCALPDASCTLHSVDIEPLMSRTTITSIAVFVAGASHLISTRAASSMPSTTLRAKLSCFGGAGSSAGEFGGAGGSVNTPWGSRGDLFVMFFCLCVVFFVRVCTLSALSEILQPWRLPGGFGKVLQGKASSGAAAASRRGLGTGGRGGGGFPTAVAIASVSFSPLACSTATASEPSSGHPIKTTTGLGAPKHSLIR